MMLRKLLFASWHCVLDPSSGASISLRDLTSLLRGRGWACRAFCGPTLDYEQSRDLKSHLQAVTQSMQHTAGGSFDTFHTTAEGLPVTVFSPPLVQQVPGVAEGYQFCALLERILDSDPPDVLLTYGGNWVGRAIISAARLRGLPVVFWLRNCSYADPRFFEPVNGILVPCEFSRDHYGRLGIPATPIPSPVIWDRVTCTHVHGRHITFVNPQPAKGVYIFARIAMELARSRPDIPLLVVEGRGGQQWLDALGIAQHPNLHVMPNTPDPRTFLGVTKALLMPSVWPETFARLPVEAFINGIPVIASNRGGLKENLRSAGFLLDVPKWCDEHTRTIPDAAEVRPWTDLVIRLWDEPAFCSQQQQRARAAAEEFREQVLADRYEAYFNDLLARTHAPVPGDRITAVLRSTCSQLLPIPDAELDRMLGRSL